MRLAAAVFAVLVAGPAAADHGGTVGSTGFGWTTWLLIAGGVIAALLAAWAMFAPERPERPPDQPPAAGETR